MSLEACLVVVLDKRKGSKLSTETRDSNTPARFERLAITRCLRRTLGYAIAMLAIVSGHAVLTWNAANAETTAAQSKSTPGGEDALTENNAKESTVGVSQKIEGLILPGTELEAVPITDYKTPIVVRIENRFVHGDQFRYDLVFYGLEPGSFDLRDYLQRTDGSSKDDLPKIPVQIKTLLPPGQVRPNDLDAEKVPRLGGYELTLWLLGIAWLIGLLVICFWGRGKKGGLNGADGKPTSLADQLRPLVEQARNGTLDEKTQAQLEHLLLIYWQTKLDVKGLPPSKAIQKLKSDSVAGKLVESLERWLHSPDTNDHVDVAKLLEPYQDIAPVEVE